MYKESSYNIVRRINNEYYLYNAITKSIIKISDYQEFKEKYANLENHVQDKLYDCGFLIDEDKNELDELQYLFNNSYYMNSNFSITLMPTLSCNLKCPYCFENGHHTMGYQENYFKALNLFFEKYFIGVNQVHISLFGGEPLLLKKEIYDCLDKLKVLSKKNKFKLSTSIITNGTLIDEKELNLLKKYDCNYFQISIDGNQYTHNQTRIYHNGEPTYRKIIDKIKFLINFMMKQNIDKKITLRINLTNQTVKDIEEVLYEFNVEERSYIQILFRAIFNTQDYVINNLNNNANLSEFYNLANNLGYNIFKTSIYNFQSCEACSGPNSFYVLPNLEIWKCVNDLSFKNAKVGEISENGELEYISNNLVKWYNASNSFNDEKCKKCELLPDCFGGCPLYNLKNSKRKCKDFEMCSLPYFYEY